MTVANLVLADVFRADLRTSQDADDNNTHLQAALGLDYRYQVARIAIAASLGDHAPPPPASDLLGKPIRGETLFGQAELDLAMWVAQIIEHSDVDPTRRGLADAVAAHWQRGVKTLSKAWSVHKGTAPEFLVQLAQGGLAQRTVEPKVKSG
jgi:DNA sulfur modification protein DndE